MNIAIHKVNSCFLILCISINLGIAQINTFYIGHSLSDQIGEMVKSMSDQQAGTQFTFGYQSIPGAPLRWQWDRKTAQDYSALPPYLYPFYDVNDGLASGDYDQLVLTESVPRQLANDWGISETYRYADSFYTYAVQHSPNIKVFFYEVWHCVQSGTPTGCAYDTDSNPWRQRLDDDLPMWESVVSYLNNKYSPRIRVCMIPGGQGLARLHDEIVAGTVPGITSISQLFSDDIHLTDQGKYFIACIHFATLHQRSPVGLPRQLQSIWGSNFNAPTQAQAQRFQEIAWETIINYDKNCLSILSSNEDEHKTELKIYPNPTSNIITLEYEGTDQLVKVFNISGQQMMQIQSKQLDLSQFPKGLYFVKVNGQFQKIIKY